MDELVLEENVPLAFPWGDVIVASFRKSDTGEESATLDVLENGKEQRSRVSQGDEVQFGSEVWRVAAVAAVLLDGEERTMSADNTPQSTLTLRRVSTVAGSQRQ